MLPMAVDGGSFNPLLTLVRAEPRDGTASRLLDLGPSGPVAADLWTGLCGGKYLAAWRPATLDLFVQAGIRLTVEGRDRYAWQLTRIMKMMDPDLAAARAGSCDRVCRRAPRDAAQGGSRRPGDG